MKREREITKRERVCVLRCVVLVVCRNAVERNAAIVAVLPVRPRMTISPPCTRHPCHTPRHARRFVGSALPFDAVEEKGARQAKVRLFIIFLFLGSRPCTIGLDGVLSALGQPLNRRRDRPVTRRFSRSFLRRNDRCPFCTATRLRHSRGGLSVGDGALHSRDDTIFSCPLLGFCPDGLAVCWLRVSQ